MKYVTVPTKRAVGGVVDTVLDHLYGDAPYDQRNGFVFHHTDEPALESVMTRAIGLWHGDLDQFRALMLNGMRADRSWAAPGAEYLKVYEYVR